MMDPCAQMLLQVSCALDGPLDDRKLTELSAHLAQCASCQARAIELGGADGLFRALERRPSPLPDLGAAFTQQVMARVRLEAPGAGGLEAFARLVAQSPDLKHEFRPAASLDLFVELFVSAGRQRGYRFDGAEVVSLLAARRAANDDLSDEQLDAVVGGVSAVDAAVQVFIGDVLKNWFKPST